MEIRKVVPIIAVDAIEPCLAFWIDRLGFAMVVQVPHEDRMGFALLARDGFEVMYQSRASMKAEVPGVEVLAQGHGVALYIDVDDVNAVERAMAGLEVVVPRRTTFYGAEEIFVRAPCGTVVGFAQQGAGS
jgi:uncharacterized glyoxalase superfamily protein PhnB